MASFMAAEYLHFTINVKGRFFTLIVRSFEYVVTCFPWKVVGACCKSILSSKHSSLLLSHGGLVYWIMNGACHGDVVQQRCSGILLLWCRMQTGPVHSVNAFVSRCHQSVDGPFNASKVRNPNYLTICRSIISLNISRVGELLNKFLDQRHLAHLYIATPVSDFVSIVIFNG